MGNKRALIFSIFFGASILFSVVVHAEIVSTSGQVREVSIIRQAFEGGSEDNNNIRIFDERQRITLDRAFTVNFPLTGQIDSRDDLFEARILTDSPVSSHLFHSDPEGNRLRTYDGCATFDEDVIGVMLLDDELDNSDDEFGLSDVTYQMDELRGFGFPTTSSTSFDELTISSDRRTVCLVLRTTFQVDQVRVITSTLGTQAIEFVNGAPPGFTDGSGRNGSGQNGDGDGDAFADSDNCGGLDNARFDIVPGNRDNIIHLDGYGKTPVGLFSSEDFDAPGCIDENSLTFGPTGNEESFMACGAWDINMDGYIDLQCDFITLDAEFEIGDPEGCMKGSTVKDESFTFCDDVKVEAKHRFINKACTIDAIRTLNLGRSFYFTALGSAIEEVKVEVFNMQGQRVFDSGYVSGNQLRWNLRKNPRLANGVYFYVVTAQGANGSIAHSKIGKLALIR